MHLVLEQSPTPIYQRLIAGICRALVAAGHRISLLDPTEFIAGSFAGSPDGCLDGNLTRLALGGVAEVDLRRSLFWDRLDCLEADALIIVSPISLLAGFELGRGTFLYEQAKAPILHGSGLRLPLAATSPAPTVPTIFVLSRAMPGSWGT